MTSWTDLVTRWAALRLKSFHARCGTHHKRTKDQFFGPPLGSKTSFTRHQTLRANAPESGNEHNWIPTMPQPSISSKGERCLWPPSLIHQLANLWHLQAPSIFSRPMISREEIGVSHGKFSWEFTTETPCNLTSLMASPRRCFRNLRVCTRRHEHPWLSHLAWHWKKNPECRWDSHWHTWLPYKTPIKIPIITTRIL